MSSQTKVQKEEFMDLKTEKASDELNLKARKSTNKFNNSLIDLEIITEETEKMNNNKRLGTNKAKRQIKKILKEFKTKKTEQLEWELRFLTLKCIFCKYLSDYKKEREAIEVRRKIMEEIDIFEMKIKKIRELIIITIEYDYDKLIGDLSMEKRLEIGRIKKNRNKARETKNIKHVN